MKTIAAVSTPLGSGGISIIRLSGSESIDIASRLFSTSRIKLADFEERKLYLGKFSCKSFNEQCLCVVFRAPRSFTGEDIVEFQIHGGASLTDEILKACLNGGAHLASPGEFTRRAFLNNKITLSSAEGTLALLQASSQAGITAATNLINERLSSKIKSWTSSLVDVIANIEVALDYPEEDIEAGTLAVTKAKINSLTDEFMSLANTFKQGRMAQNGINIVIAGKPNVGKSSLLNAFLHEERALVTDIAGTTRDILRERIEYKGAAFNFIDTAGIRENADSVEKLGITLAKQALQTADIIIFLCDNTFDDNDVEILLSLPEGIPVIKVCNKSDIIFDGNTSIAEIKNKQIANTKTLKPSGVDFDIAISAKEGTNIDGLKDLIYQKTLSDNFDQSGEMLVLQRHYACVTAALDSLQSASACHELHLVTVDLRTALSHLYEITGENVSEQVVDRIFEKFCLGK